MMILFMGSIIMCELTKAQKKSKTSLAWFILALICVIVMAVQFEAFI